eukprot:9479764-Pyramimonas_sp.AAC.1
MHLVRFLPTQKKPYSTMRVPIEVLPRGRVASDEGPGGKHYLRGSGGSLVGKSKMGMRVKSPQPLQLCQRDAMGAAVIA